MQKSITLPAALMILVLLSHTNMLDAQINFSISGKLIDQNDKPVSFANVTLLSLHDSSLIAGTVSGNSGEFQLKYNKKGRYIFAASFIGYSTCQQIVELSEQQQIQLNEIVLQNKQTRLNEVVFIKERVKARQEVNKTTYYVNPALRATSGNGIDLVSHIPDIQVDLFQKLSMGGSDKIRIQVNGIEKDAGFLARIHPDKIDRVEVIHSPGAAYDAGITGVINVVLKKNENRGISGHMDANIPTADNEVFSFPTASMEYSRDKIALYTSYTGAFSYFDIEAGDKRKFTEGRNQYEISKEENVAQQNWSHKMHFGMDYFHNENNQLKLYGFISRFSNNLSGTTNMNALYGGLAEKFMTYNKEDHDMNTSAHASAYYKHIVKPDHELSLESAWYQLTSENFISLQEPITGTELASQTRPSSQIVNLRLKYKFPLNEFTSFASGAEQKIRYSEDALLPDFSHTEYSSAAYLSMVFSKNNWQVKSGLRAEYIKTFSYTSEYNNLFLLPSLHFTYTPEKGKNISLSYRKGITRPFAFQLNPGIQLIDPYASWEGNPEVKHEINHIAKIDYGIVIGSSYLKTGLFFEHDENVLEVLTKLKEEYLLQKKMHNAGSIRTCGVAASGSFKLHKSLSINPLLKLYRVKTQASKDIENYGIENRRALNLTSSVSMMYLMKQNFALSFSLQYTNRKTAIQNDYRDDALYFLSLEKSFFNTLKIGITSAIPFGKTFTFQSYDIQGKNFSQYTKDNIRMSLFPVWIKLNYSFASGKKARRIERTDSFTETRKKKGF